MRLFQRIDYWLRAGGYKTAGLILQSVCASLNGKATSLAPVIELGPMVEVFFGGTGMGWTPNKNKLEVICNVAHFCFGIAEAHMKVTLAGLEKAKLAPLHSVKSRVSVE